MTFYCDDPRLPQRFWDKVTPEPNSGCWLWTGYVMPFGHGQFRWQGQTRLAHRVAYTVLVGEHDEGLELDHLCRQPSCVRPDHLEPVPHAVNMRRGRAGEHTRNRTHCPQGHPYDEANTVVFAGRRNCRICKQGRLRAWREKTRRPGVVHNGKKTHCKRGHPFDEANTRITPDGRRCCRTCARMREAKRNRYAR